VVDGCKDYERYFILVHCMAFVTDQMVAQASSIDLLSSSMEFKHAKWLISNTSPRKCAHHQKYSIRHAR